MSWQLQHTSTFHLQSTFEVLQFWQEQRCGNQAERGHLGERTKEELNVAPLSHSLCQRAIIWSPKLLSLIVCGG